MRTMLEGIVEHDIYHIGQIALLTRFFKSGVGGNSIFRNLREYEIW